MLHLWSFDLACIRQLSKPFLAFDTKGMKYHLYQDFLKLKKIRDLSLSSFYICTACNFDFEHGIDGWERTGTDFNNQPTFGDNPTARNRKQPSKHQGEWWIGGFENRPSKEAKAGAVQGDEPRGTLTSSRFRIIGKGISFLIGGGCNMTSNRAELLVDNEVECDSAFSRLSQRPLKLQERL